MTRLAFSSQLDELGDLQLFYDSNQNESLAFIDDLGIDEFDKLMF